MTGMLPFDREPDPKPAFVLEDFEFKKKVTISEFCEARGICGAELHLLVEEFIEKNKHWCRSARLHHHNHKIPKPLVPKKFTVKTWAAGVTEHNRRPRGYNAVLMRAFITGELPSITGYANKTAKELDALEAKVFKQEAKGIIQDEPETKKFQEGWDMILEAIDKKLGISHGNLYLGLVSEAIPQTKIENLICEKHGINLEDLFEFLLFERLGINKEILESLAGLKAYPTQRDALLASFGFQSLLKSQQPLSLSSSNHQLEPSEDTQ